MSFTTYDVKVLVQRNSSPVRDLHGGDQGPPHRHWSRQTQSHFDSELIEDGKQLHA